MPKDYRQADWYKPTLQKMIRDAGDQALESMYRDTSRPVYLWYKESQGAEWGALAVGLDAPSGKDWKLAKTNRISPAWPPERVRVWMYDTIRELPILPTM